MPQTIYIQDYDTEIEIPDGADMAQVQAALQKQFPAKTAGATPAPAQATPDQADTPAQKESGLRRAASAVAPYARPALEIGGALAGGALATPAGPVGALAGAGLGYAAGRKVADALDVTAGRKDPETVGQALGSAALSVPEGAAMEAGGAIIGLPIKKGLEAVAKAAPRIYEAVAKIPPRSVPKADRDKAIKTALEYGIPATESGFKKLRGMIDETNDRIAAVINDAAATTREAVKRNVKSGVVEYDEGKIAIPDILRRLDSVKKWAADSFGDPRPVIKQIDEFKKNVLATRGKEITVDAAQKLKQGIYRRLTDSAYGEYSTASKEIDKAFARGIKEELLEKFPVLRQLNQKDSSLIALQNVLENTVNRTRNWDVIGLTDLAGSGVGAVYGGIAGKGDIKEGGKGAAVGLLVARTLRSPAVMSRLAFALAKAGKAKLAKAGKAKPTIAPRALAYPAVQEGPRNQALNAMMNATATPAEATETRRQVDSIIPQSGTQASSLVNTGTASYQAGNYPKAIASFQQAMQLDPSRKQYYQQAIDMAMAEQAALQKRGLIQ